MRMQSSSESGRVAYCLPIGITSSKTKCVRLRNGLSLQRPKQISARAIVDGQFLCCAFSVLAITLYKNFPQNVLVVLIAAKATAWAMYRAIASTLF